jgi:YebC/PmpR family DNA-binding regulatory protein
MGRHGTIAGRKEKQDKKRGAEFTKCARAIIQAAKAGGGDPISNSSLRNAIDKAKSINMPNDKINNAIKRGTGELQGEVIVNSTFEGYGPGGIAVIVEVLTDNPNRTTSFIKNVFSKNNGNIGVPGCVSYMFNRKGLILLEKTDSIIEDELMEVALEAGAEDFKDEDEFFEILTDTENFQNVVDSLKENKYEIVEKDIELIPDLEVEAKDENTKKNLDRLIDMLEDNDDVQKVYTNAK